MNEVVQVGLTHRSAPLASRERRAVSGQVAGPLAAEIARSSAVREALVLATCARVEIYAVGTDAAELETALLERLESSARDEPGTLVEARRGTDAARHLLRTAAGLESPVLGEPEILGQVRRAHASASVAAATGPTLERLVVQALRAGRRVRAETGVSAGATSLTSTVAVLARGLVGDTAGRRGLVLGDTRTARVTADRLLRGGWSVTASPAARGLERALPAFDVVVACSGGRIAVGSDMLRTATRGRIGTPMLVVDLSVPRDVDPAARSLPGVLLYDVDEVAVAAQRELAARRSQVPAAEAIVEEELRRFEAWRATRALAPVIQALREHQRRAVDEVLGPLPEALVERLLTRLLHHPTARLRAAAATGAEECWTRTACELFGLADGVGPDG
jgi:glutamyl-tRNA reductase